MVKYENTFIEVSDVIDILEYFENNKKYMFEVYYYRHHCFIRFLLNNKSNYNQKNCVVGAYVNNDIWRNNVHRSYENYLKV